MKLKQHFGPLQKSPRLPKKLRRSALGGVKNVPQKKIARRLFADWHIKQRNHPAKASRTEIRNEDSRRFRLAAAVQRAHAAPLREHNLFRFTDTKTAFVTRQLSVEPPPGPLESPSRGGAHPARLRSHPGAATLSPSAWRWRSRLSHFSTAWFEKSEVVQKRRWLIYRVHFFFFFFFLAWLGEA